MPISNEGFTKSMIESAGVITGAGFETPAEALYLGKKLICLPIRGQYEQLCNAAALEKLGVPIVHKIHPTFFVDIAKWYDLPAPTPLKLEHSTYQLVQKVIEQAKALNPAQENNVANENLNSFAV
jgi:UDP-N-acetylglucosamine:LPS N-acetylglucosamine transferase